MIDLNKIAIIAGEHNVTYSELLQRVAQFALVKTERVGRMPFSLFG